jgi:hypothetical protein
MVPKATLNNYKCKGDSRDRGHVPKWFKPATKPPYVITEFPTTKSTVNLSILWQNSVLLYLHNII